MLFAEVEHAVDVPTVVRVDGILGLGFAKGSAVVEHPPTLIDRLFEVCLCSVAHPHVKSVISSYGVCVCAFSLQNHERLLEYVTTRTLVAFAV